MAKKFAIVIFLLLALPALYSNKFEVRGDSVVANTIQNEVISRKLDPQAQILAAYLTKYNSPLVEHAQDFVDAARAYDLDWRLVAAISGVESTFGQNAYGFNAWGWGIYGNQALDFRSWKDGIFTVSQGLRQNYLNKGLTNPYTINRNYAASPHWGSKVSYFMQDMEKFANEYPSYSVVVITPPQTAAISGQLALN